MRPPIIGIGGGHSGAGKTAVACLILQSFAGWGAIKYTRTSLYASVIEEQEILSEEGKDTRKFLDAGAAKVLWVKSPHMELGEVLPVAVGMLSHLRGILIEGNSAIEIMKPDIVIFVCGAGESMKKSSLKILQLADVVVYRSHEPPGTPQRAILFEENRTERLIQFLSERIKGFPKNFV